MTTFQTIMSSSDSDLFKMEALYKLYLASSVEEQKDLQPLIDKAADELEFDTIVANWLTSPDGSWEKDFALKHEATTNWRFICAGTFPDAGNFAKEEMNAYVVHKYTVTQEEYEKVIGKNPSHYDDRPDAPVESVSFYDACCFANMQSQLMGCEPVYYFQLDKDGSNITPLTQWDGDNQTVHAIFENEKSRGPRLPTEKEWEFACRAGTATDTYNGDLPSNEEKAHKVLDDIAWYNNNTQHDRRPQSVGQKKPNPWGLYDTIGNVWEWTSTPYE